MTLGDRQSCAAAFKGLLIACCALVLVACQPAPAERHARAQAFYAQADYRAAVLELKNALQKEPDFAEAALLLAQSSYMLADFQTSEVEAERALTLGLNRTDVWLSLGHALLAQGKATEVIERVMPALSSESAAPEQSVLLGDTFLALGNLNEARTQYGNALIVDSGNPAAVIGLAAVANENGEAERAMELLRQARELHPDSDLVWRAWGNFLASTSQPADAASAYEQAILLETGATTLADRLMTRVNRVTVLLDARDLGNANEAYSGLLEEFSSHPVVRFLRGRLAYANGDYGLAESELREYLADFPTDLRGFALLGAVNFSQNHLLQAETYLSQAARNKVGGEAVVRLLAETQLRLNKPDAALQALSLSEGSENVDPVLLTMYGRAQLGLGDTATALEYFERGASSGISDPAIGLSIASGFFAADDSDRAIEILEGIPPHKDARYLREVLLIAAHIRKGNRAEALVIGDQLVAVHPHDANAFVTVGALQQTLGDFVAARVALQRAIELDPTIQPALYAMSRLELLEGNRSEGLRLLDLILSDDPSFLPALLTMTEALDQDGRLAEMTARLQAAIDDDPDAMALRLLQIRVLLARNEADIALQRIRVARENVAEDWRLSHAEGIALLKMGQREAALSSLRRADDDHQNSPALQFDLASLALEMGDYKVAERSAGRYRALLPKDSRGLALQVAALGRQKKLDTARRAVADYISKYPEDPNAAVLAGDIELAAGNLVLATSKYELAAEQLLNRQIVARLARVYQASDLGKAEAIYEVWLRENPDDSDIRRRYAQLLESAGQATLAVEQYEIIVSTQADPIALNNLAWEYARSGKPGAVALAERAHQLAPDEGRITDTYGWILFMSGDLNGSLPLIEKAARQSPEDPEIQYHLAAVHAKAGNRSRASAIIAGLLETETSFPSRAEAELLAKSL